MLVPALPGCFTRGAAVEECRERAIDVVGVHVAAPQAEDESVPEEIGTPQLLALTVAA